MFKRLLATYSSWATFRRRERIAWLLFFGFVPGVVVVGTGLSKLFDSVIPVVVVAFAWTITFMVLAFFAYRFRCPRCGKPFFQKTRFHSSFVSNCVHCGLAKWHEPDNG